METITSYILIINNQPHEVLVYKKKIKSLRLKISADSKISLSIPYRYPFSKAFDFLLSKQDWISTNLTKLKSRIKDKQCEFTNNSEIYILGEKRKVKLIESKRENIFLENDQISFHLKNLSYDYIYKKFYKWATAHLNTIVENIAIKYFNLYFSHLEKPSFKYKKMKSMWGNCKYTKNIITLNSYLIKAPTECIKYVVIHELVHLIYHDHGKNFKSFLSKILPNWKLLKKQLNEYLLYF